MDFFSIRSAEVVRGAAAPAVILMTLAFILGCTNSIRLKDSLDEPVPVILVDHGRHPSLLLPDAEGGVRYTWGEWRWYGKNEVGVLRGISAVLWPTQAALGRYRFDEWPEAGLGRYLVPEGYRELLRFDVEEEDAQALKQRLDAVFETGREEASVFNRVYRLEFVPLDERYWVFNQSNQRMISWLRELGLEVRGPGLYSTWRVVGDES